MDYETATAERRRHVAMQFEAPEIDRGGNHKPQRVCSTFDLLHRRGKLDADQFAAGEQLTIYWRTVHDVGGVVGAYGDQRWNGTPAAQVSAHLLSSQERKTHALGMLRRSEEAIDDTMLWTAVITVIINDGSVIEAGKAIGYLGRDRSQAAGMVAIRAGLQRLARFYAKPRGRP